MKRLSLKLLHGDYSSAQGCLEGSSCLPSVGLKMLSHKQPPQFWLHIRINWGAFKAIPVPRLHPRPVASKSMETDYGNTHFDSPQVEPSLRPTAPREQKKGVPKDKFELSAFTGTDSPAAGRSCFWHRVKQHLLLVCVFCFCYVSKW